MSNNELVLALAIVITLYFLVDETVDKFIESKWKEKKNGENKH